MLSFYSVHRCQPHTCLIDTRGKKTFKLAVCWEKVHFFFYNRKKSNCFFTYFFPKFPLNIALATFQVILCPYTEFHMHSTFWGFVFNLIWPPTLSNGVFGLIVFNFITDIAGFLTTIFYFPSFWCYFFFLFFFELTQYLINSFPLLTW